eukprot:575788_1
MDIRSFFKKSPANSQSDVVAELDSEPSSQVETQTINSESSQKENNTDSNAVECDDDADQPKKKRRRLKKLSEPEQTPPKKKRSIEKSDSKSVSSSKKRPLDTSKCSQSSAKKSKPSSAKKSKSSSVKKPKPSSAKEPKPSSAKKSKPSSAKKAKPSSAKKAKPASAKKAKPSTPAESESDSNDDSTEPGVSKSESTGDKTSTPSIKKPKPASVKKPKPASAKKPKPASVKKPKPASAKKPKPASVKKPKPSSVKKPKPASAKKPKPASAKKSKPTSVKTSKPASAKKSKPASAKKHKPAIVEKPKPGVEEPKPVCVESDASSSKKSKPKPASAKKSKSSSGKPKPKPASEGASSSGGDVKPVPKVVSQEPDKKPVNPAIANFFSPRQPKKKAPKIEKSPLASVVSDECSESDSNWEEPSGEPSESDASDPEPSASDTSGSEASEQEPSEVSSSKKKPAEKSPKVKVEKSSGYDVVEDAGWKAGEPVPFLALARAFKRVESISGRLKTIEVMANLFRSVIALTPEEFLPIIYLCVNKIAPPYENLEVGVGDGLLYKAIELTTGRKMSQLKTAVEEQGDLGIVAEQCRGKQRLMFKPKPLTCRYVFDTIKSLSQIEGNKSRDKKIGLINKLFVSARESEARYIVRSLQGKMRLGFSEQSVLVAIARACALTPPAQSGTPPEMLDTAKQLSKSKFEKRFSESEKIIKRVYSEVPNWDMVIPNLMSVGLEVLPEKCFLTPGIPIKAMLAKPTKGIQEILERFANLLFTLEYKYDGERIQVHYLGDGKFEFFSRNAERSTGKFPDIQAYLPNVFDKEKVESFIIDCEVVAWDIEKKKILPFQTLSTRKRKDVNTKDITVQVCLFAFDCLYMNGESLLQKPFMDRRAALHDNFEEKPGQLMFATNRDTSDPEDIQTFLDEAIRASCEGLMVKTLKKEATYEPSKRSHSWLKVKKDYLSGCMDSLDLVPIGGYHGKGKRAGVFGAYLVACYDPDREEYQAICKIGTGLKDDFLASSSKFFADGHTIAKPPSYFRLPDTTSDRPDAWFEPCQVWEVKCADLSLSPKYFAAQGLVSERKGIALRFPRFIRIREDKNVEDATNSEQVADMYKSQAVVS